MKAVQINGYGGIEVLELNQNAPQPVAKENQLLVEVYASSINPIDWKIRDGYMKNDGWLDQLKFPITLGSDFSGVIKKVIDGASELKVEDEVYGYANVLYGGSGSFADFVAVNSNNLTRKPKNISHDEVASLPLVGVSALQAIEDNIKLQGGQKILIHGGAGGIGSIAIQIAKSKKAYIATTVSGDNIDYVKSLGADEPINYKTQKFEGILKDFDAVFDTVGGETRDKSFKVLKRGGILVSMLGAPDQKLAETYGVISSALNTNVNSENLERLAKLVEEETIKPQVDKVYPIEKVREGFVYQEQVHPRGKVVLKIK